MVELFCLVDLWFWLSLITHLFFLEGRFGNFVEFHYLTLFFVGGWKILWEKNTLAMSKAYFNEINGFKAM